MPTLTEALRQDPRLLDYLKTTCAERGMSITLDPRLTPADVVVLAPDVYYNTERPNPPPSPDCLVVVRCADGSYTVYIVELKDIESPAGFSIENMRAKFDTALHDFMSGVLGHYFNDPAYSLRRVRLYFVTAPYGPNRAAADRLARTPKLDLLLSMRAFRYDGRPLGIEHHLPSPAIGPC